MGLIIRYGGGDITSTSSNSGLEYNKLSKILENSSVARGPPSEAQLQQQGARSIKKQYHNLSRRSISILKHLGYNVRQT